VAGVVHIVSEDGKLSWQVCKWAKEAQRDWL